MRQDHEIQAAVSGRLDLDPSINSSHIGVAARNGIVTLTGHVASLGERGSAERAAGGVKGVKAIINQIAVELPGAALTPDEQLAEQAYARIHSNIAVPKNRLRLSVKDGAITLHGDVDWPFQLHAAQHDLQQLAGARAVHSDARIRPPVNADKVDRKVREALAAVAPLDAERISVTVEGSKVVLAGDVTSWHEKGLAESTAWCVPGVSEVVNNISVL